MYGHNSVQIKFRQEGTLVSHPTSSAISARPGSMLLRFPMSLAQVNLFYTATPLRNEASVFYPKRLPTVEHQSFIHKNYLPGHMTNLRSQLVNKFYTLISKAATAGRQGQPIFRWKALLMFRV